MVFAALGGPGSRLGLTLLGAVLFWFAAVPRPRLQSTPPARAVLLTVFVLMWLFVATLAWGGGHPALRGFLSTARYGADLELFVAFAGVLTLGISLRSAAAGQAAAARRTVIVALLMAGAWGAMVAISVTTAIVAPLLGLGIWVLAGLIPASRSLEGALSPTPPGCASTTAGATTITARPRKHVLSAVLICLASVIAAAVGFQIFVSHVVARFEDACPWGTPGMDGHPVRVGAATSVGAGLVALCGMLLRRTNLPGWVVVAAATMTVVVAGFLAGLSWFFIGACFG